MNKIFYTLMLVVLVFTTVLCPGKKQEGTASEPTIEQQQPAGAEGQPKEGAENPAAPSGTPGK